MISLQDDEPVKSDDHGGLLPKSIILSSTTNESYFKIKEKSYSVIRTLDEPIGETLKRDLFMIFTKLKYLLNPKAKTDNFKELRKWDLWGPLLLCLLLAGSLSIRSEAGQTDLLFALIFVLNWIGALIITFNARLLGGKVSIFQSVCVLGYSIFPLCVSSILLFACHSFMPNYGKFLIVALGLSWCFVITIGFMGSLVTEKKKYLAAYPTMLFYSFIAWFVLMA